MRSFINFAALVIFVISPSLSHAYYSTMDTAELIPANVYKLNLETQFITDNDSGANILGRFDNRIDDESSYRIELGFGSVDFQVAGFYKWAPIPDTGKQPAMALMAGVSVANNEDLTDLSLRAHPIISKRFDANFGDLTPYSSLPIGLRTVDGDTDITAQLVIGANLKPTRFENISFISEIGFDLSEAFTYFSIGVNLNVDPEQGMQFN